MTEKIKYLIVTSSYKQHNPDKKITTILQNEKFVK